MQKKRHHFVPKAYLRAFADVRGKLLIYRKNAPAEPQHVRPEATQFRRYYYSQPTPDGGMDNNALEDLFATVESEWPNIVERMHRGENVNSKLDEIIQFILLQRIRVPASRDLVESVLAARVRVTLTSLFLAGKLPQAPEELGPNLENVEVSIDPHRSIHAMTDMMN